MMAAMITLGSAKTIWKFMILAFCFHLAIQLKSVNPDVFQEVSIVKMILALTWNTAFWMKRTGMRKSGKVAIVIKNMMMMRVQIGMELDGTGSKNQLDHECLLEESPKGVDVELVIQFG